MNSFLKAILKYPVNNICSLIKSCFLLADKQIFIISFFNGCSGFQLITFNDIDAWH